jgi:hypothetical protein
MSNKSDVTKSDPTAPEDSAIKAGTAEQSHINLGGHGEEGLGESQREIPFNFINSTERETNAAGLGNGSRHLPS